MFIIDTKTISDELYPSSIVHDLERYSTLFNKMITTSGHEFFAIDNLSDANFFANFSFFIDEVLDCVQANKTAFDGYVRILSSLAANKQSTEDIQRTIIAFDKCSLPSNTSISNNKEKSEIDMPIYLGYVPAFIKIVSNEPNTIIYFDDGSHVKVTCEKDTPFDAKQGILLALLKKAYGSKNLQHLYNILETINIKSESKPVPDDDLPDGIESVNIDDWDSSEYLDTFVSDVLETGFAD